MQLDLDEEELRPAQTPMFRHPSSPQEAINQLPPPSALLSPFSRGRAQSVAPAPLTVPAAPSFLQSSSEVRHRLSALGALPPPLAAALRQRELQPQADHCSVGCGTGGLAWAALGSTLYVWRAAAPQGCRRLASPLPAELAHAELACEVQPNAGTADEVLLLACWATRSSCRLTLYRLSNLSQPPPLASPPPVAELTVPLPAAVAPAYLKPTPGTVLPAAPAAAAAVLAVSNAQLFAVGVEARAAVAGGSGDDAHGSYALRLARIDRGNGSVRAVVSAVASYFSAAPRQAPAAQLSALAVAADWMLTLTTTSGAATEPPAVGSPPPPAGEEVLDCFRRGSAGQVYAHAGSQPLRPLIREYLGASGPSAEAAETAVVADVVALPADDAAAGGGKLLVLLAVGDVAATAMCELRLMELAISSSGALRLSTTAPAAIHSPVLGAAEVAQIASLRLVAAHRALGPAVALRPSVSFGRGLIAGGAGGEAWALRDVGGESSAELVGVAGGVGGGGLLGPIPDARLLGAGGDEQGVILLYSHQIVRLAALPTRSAAATRPSVRMATLGSDAPAADAAFLRKLGEAFAAYEAAHQNGWHGATELGRAVEEEAAAMAAGGGAVRALLALSEKIAASALSKAELEAQLASRLAQHRLLVQFARLHSLLDAAAQPLEAAALITHGEKLAAGLALRQLQNGASPEHSAMLINLFEGVVRRVPSAASGAADDDAQEAFYGALLVADRWEALLAGLTQAASAAVGEDERTSHIAFVCEAAVKPLIAARTYRADVSIVLVHTAAAGAAEAAAVAAGVRHWTCTTEISDEPLIVLSGAACGALGALGPPSELPPMAASKAEVVAGLVETLAAMHEERMLGLLAQLRAAATAAESSEAFAPGSALKPPPLSAFEKGREQAASALLSVGALPHASALAEAFHDYKNLGAMCTRLPPSLPATLLRGRRITSTADLRHELIARLAAAPPAAPLFAHEDVAQEGFVHEMCLAHYEAGAAGCRELLRLPESYPFLAGALKTFLAAYPRLLWLHLVDEAGHAPDSAAASHALDAAARALYGWGLQSAQGVAPMERRAFLSLGMLCHRAAVAPDAPAAGLVDAEKAADAAAAGLPPLPPRAIALDALPKVRGVPVSVEGERREMRLDVGLGDVANEQYALRVQETLPLSGEAVPTEQMITALLEHARDPAGQAFGEASLGNKPLGRDDALALAIDLAKKTAWRYATSQRGVAARRGTLVRILHTAFESELTHWRDIATQLTNLNDAQLLAALGGTAHGHPTPGAPPLALFALLVYQASKAAASGSASDDDEWLGAGVADEEGSMLLMLMASVQLPDEVEVRRVAGLVQRAQAFAAQLAAPAAPAQLAADEEWVNVDAMQM